MRSTQVRGWARSAASGVALALSVAVAAACTTTGTAPTQAPGATTGTGASASPAGEVRKVKLVLDYLMDAAKAPLVLGKEKGFFEKRGIDVEISEGTGSGDLRDSSPMGPTTSGSLPRVPPSPRSRTASRSSCWQTTSPET